MNTVRMRIITHRLRRLASHHCHLLACLKFYALFYSACHFFLLRTVWPREPVAGRHSITLPPIWGQNTNNLASIEPITRELLSTEFHSSSRREEPDHGTGA